MRQDPDSRPSLIRADHCEHHAVVLSLALAETEQALTTGDQCFIRTNLADPGVAERRVTFIKNVLEGQLFGFTQR